MAPSYYALLLADGDRVEPWCASLVVMLPGEDPEFSEAYQTSQDHDGVTIYGGGDVCWQCFQFQCLRCAEDI